MWKISVKKAATINRWAKKKKFKCNIQIVFNMLKPIYDTKLVFPN